MKERLSCALFFTLLECTKWFVVYYHASSVVMQHRKVIANASSKVKVHERNYPTHDLELTTVVFALKIWSHYLYGVHVDVFTDQKRLQYVFIQMGLNLWQRRWLELFKIYDMNVLYNPSKANVVGDARSRMTMGSVSHIDEYKKDLVNYVHRFSRFSVTF